MKLSLLLLVGLSVPFSISAQVITGGLMAAPQFTFMVATQNIRSFEEHIVQKHKWCPSAGLIKLNKADLMDSYLKLVLLRETHANGNDCGKANAYLKCMNDEMTVSKLAKIKNDEISIMILMSRYDISSARVHQILNFFDKLEKKIE
jgi:hypothetical protein